MRIIRTILFLNISILFLLFFFFVHVNPSFAAALTWDGGGNDTICGGSGTGNNWSCAQNWNTDTVPTSSDTLTFNATSTKNSVVDATHSGTITSVNITTGYSGTLSLDRSLSTSSTFAQSTGTFTAGSNALDINSTFTLSGGTFNAPSTTASLAAAMTVTGTPTFNNNNGTFVFDGSGGTLSCGNIAFNFVIFQDTASNKIVENNCILPVGSNPVFPRGVNLRGVASGSGTLTIPTGGTLTMHNPVATLSGFNGLNIQGINITGGATADFSTYTSFVTGNTITVTSGTLSLPSGADMNGNLTINGGVVNAPTGSIFLAGTFTHSSGTFNPGTGTLVLDGGNATITCGTANFHLVVFSQTGTKTVSNTCDLPLGDNPVTTGNITLNGILRGTGTITTGGLLTVASGTPLQDFTGIIANQITNNGATLDFSSYSPVDLNGNYTMSAGSFTAPPGDMSAAANFSITGGTFDNNNGTVYFDGATGGTINCNGQSFNIVYFTHTAGGKTIGPTCSIDVGHNPQIGTPGTAPATITVQGTLSGSGKISTTDMTVNGVTAVLSGFSGLYSESRLVLSGGAVVDMSNYTEFDIARFFIINSSAVFTAPSLMEIRENWTHSAGTFNHNNGTVKFTGNESTISAGVGTTFYNLTKQGGTFMRFTTSGIQVMEGTLTLTGNEGNLLILTSNGTTQWSIDPRGQRNVGYVNVNLSNNVNAQPIIASNSTDSGNNTNWQFVTVAPPQTNPQQPANPSAPSCGMGIPATPQLTSVTANGLSSLNLSFTTPQGSFDSYTVEYGTGPDSFQYSGINIAGPQDQTATIDMLAPYTLYYVRIRAGNGCAPGQWSNVISARPGVYATYSKATKIQSTTKKPATTKTTKQVSGVSCSYVVKPNDNLWKISIKQFGTGTKYNQIKEANVKAYPSLKSSNNLTVGWKLTIPGSKTCKT